MNTKLLLFLSALIFSTTFVKAQTSTMGFNFQGYAIDPDGKAIGATGITVKFTLTPGPYTEEHTVTTDAFGVFTAIIGTGTVATGSVPFKDLDYTLIATTYNLKVEVKKTSGGTYTTISNGAMNAVPYARYAFNGVPVGTIVAYGGSTTKIPEGWLLCDGAVKAQSAYPQLYAIIGGAWGTSGTDFNLPDLRGRFLRGVSGTSTNDPNTTTRTAINTGGNTKNNVGSLQGEDMKSHNHGATSSAGGSHVHTVYGDATGGFNAAGTFQTSDRGANSNANTSSAGNHQHTVTVDFFGGSETRPKNANVYYIIKY